MYRITQMSGTHYAYPCPDYSTKTMDEISEFINSGTPVLLVTSLEDLPDWYPVEACDLVVLDDDSDDDDSVEDTADVPGYSDLNDDLDEEDEEEDFIDEEE